MLARDGDINPAFSVKTDKDFLSLAPGTLTAVIAGCNADLDAIRAVVEKCAPSLPVKVLVRAPANYHLQVVDS